MPRTYVRLTLDLDPELDEKLRFEAAKLGLSKSEHMRRRLRAPLPRRNPKDHLKKKEGAPRHG
jgi:hypothetical protein